MQSLTTRIFSANYEGQSGIGTHCRCHLMHCTNSRNRDLRQAENACLPWPFWCAATSAGGLASGGRGHFRACWRLLHALVEKNSEMLLQCCCRARVQLGQQLLEWLLENKTPVADMLPRVRIFCGNSAYDSHLQCCTCACCASHDQTENNRCSDHRIGINCVWFNCEESLELNKRAHATSLSEQLSFFAFVL